MTTHTSETAGSDSRRRRLGPRARRRLAALVLAALLIVAATIYHFAGNGNSAPKVQKHPFIGSTDLGIAYGTTATELLHELGPPTSKHANCWTYWGQPGRIRGRPTLETMDATRFCFSIGATGAQVVTEIKNHCIASTFHKRHFPAQWCGMVNISPPNYPSGGSIVG